MERIARLLSWSAMVVFAIAASWVSGAGATERFKPYIVPGQGVSLAVPATWRALDFRQARSDEQVGRFGRGGLAVDLWGTISELQSPNSPLKFVAVDPKVYFRTPPSSGDRPYRANVNVVITRVSPGLTFEGHRRALMDQLRKGLAPTATSIVDDVVSIAGRRAVRVRVSDRVKVGNMTLTFLRTQFAFLQSGRGIYITYETVKELRSRYEPVFRASASTIRVR